MDKMWEPTFDDWTEDKVTLSICEVATHSTSRNEYGVMVQMGAGDEPYAGNAAIFWIDPLHLYLRYDWDVWYRISNEDPDNCANLCKRSTATLLLCTATAINHHAVRVYHIDSLPKELFGKQESDASRDAKATQLDFDLLMSIDDDTKKTACVPEEKDSVFLTTKILEMGGHHITHYGREPYQSDFYELNGHFIAASYFGLPGDWLADEESEAGTTAVWFSTEGIATSPVAIAGKIRAALAPICITLLPFHSLVLINPRCNIMNESNYFENWKDRSICLVRQQCIRDSGLGTVEDALKGYSGTRCPKLVEYASQIEAALDSALKNQ